MIVIRKIAFKRKVFKKIVSNSKILGYELQSVPETNNFLC